MKHFFALLSLFFLIITVSFGQVSWGQFDSNSVKPGTIRIYRDIRLDTLVQRVYIANENEPKINGYRIQIYSGSNRSAANQLKAIFMTDYSNERAYLSYSQPYFKLRVGNFRSKAEAIGLYQVMKEDERFKAVLIVPDKIDLPDLKKHPVDETED